MVLGLAFVLFVWGIYFDSITCRLRPIPDVASKLRQRSITQWPGIAAEQIEQQVTIPLETVMNGIPGVVQTSVHFRCSAFSDLKLIFEDGSDNAWNRERVLERLEPGHSALRRHPADGHRLESRRGGSNLFLHPAQRQSGRVIGDPDGTKVRSEDWVVEKNLKVRPRYRRRSQLRGTDARIPGSSGSQQDWLPTV